MVHRLGQHHDLERDLIHVLQRQTVNHDLMGHNRATNEPGRDSVEQYLNESGTLRVVPEIRNGGHKFHLMVGFGCDPLQRAKFHPGIQVDLMRHDLIEYVTVPI
jgi:hypothetical protein